MSSYTLPSPVGGWNARDSKAAMPEYDASVLENLIPYAEFVETRPGISAHSSDLGDAVETLIVYKGSGYLKEFSGSSGTDALLCAAGGKLINITAGGAGTNLATGLTNDRWNHAEFGNRLILCNGADAVRDILDGAISTTAVYGHNRISNGDFATGAIWTLGTGWSIGSGAASKAAGTASSLSQTPTYALQNGQTYFVTFTVSNRTAGSVNADVGGTNGTTRSGNETYTETITAGAGTDFAIEADSSFDGDIDDVIIAKTSEDFITCAAHHGRMFYIEDGSQAFHYAEAGAYAGYTSRFDLSVVAGTGAQLMFMTSWSRDGGAGMDDMGAFFFEDGHVAVYSGTDPSSVSDWNLVGVFKIGAPLGRRAATSIGGDVIVLTVDGYVPISIALVEGQYSEQSAFSYKIDNAAKGSAQDSKAIYGWSSIHVPEKGWFVVNVPLTSTTAEQHVRNTSTGAWCKFTGWNAVQFAIYSDDVYFCSPDGFVYQVTGTDDDGAVIPYKAIQAYNYFGNPHQRKTVSTVQATTDFGHPKSLHHQFYSDFYEPTLGSVADPPAGAGSGAVVPARHNVTGNGLALAHIMRFNSDAEVVKWWNTQITFKYAGTI